MTKVRLNPPASSYAPDPSCLAMLFLTEDLVRVAVSAACTAQQFTGRPVQFSPKST